MREVTAIAAAARRPASWLTLLATMVVSAAGGTALDGRAQLAAGGFAATLAAVAAIGEFPVGFLTGSPRNRFFEGAVWGGGRILFPMLGWLAGIALRRGVDAAHGAILLGLFATAVIMVGCRWAGARAADAASVAMASALVAIGIGQDALQMAAAWLIAGLVAVSAVGHATRRATGHLPRSSGQNVWLAPLPSASPVRRWMVRGAMVVCVVAMASLLLDSPIPPGWYAVAAVALFATLAVPQMTIADGIPDREAWQLLLAGRPQRPAAGWPAKTAFASSSRVALGHAGMLVWPLAVAGLLSRGGPEHRWNIVACVLAVLLATGFAMAVARLVPARRGGAETALAVIFAGFCLAVVAGGPVLGLLGRFFRTDGWEFPVESLSESMLSRLG